LTSCEKPRTIEEQLADQVVVEARLTAGAPVTDFRIHGLAGHGDAKAYSNLDVVLVDSDGLELPLHASADEDGLYHSAAGELIQEEMFYTLAFDFKGRRITSESMVPPNMEVIDSSKDYIDTEILGELIFVDWSGINSGSFNRYFYLVELIPLDEDLESIRSMGNATVVNPVGSKMISYNNSTTLSLANFDYYGEHIIRISAVDKEHEHLFKEQMEVNQNGPSNIQGGFGYFYAASAIETVIDIRR